MTGVEILAAQEVATAFTFSWDIFWMAFAICIGVSFVIGVLCSCVEEDAIPLVTLLICGIIAGVLFGTVVGSVEQTPTEYETQYKVVISDEVSMNDFLEKYEIVDQEGKIYTVREIND